MFIFNIFKNKLIRLVLVSLVILITSSLFVYLYFMFLMLMLRKKLKNKISIFFLFNEDINIFNELAKHELNADKINIVYEHSVLVMGFMCIVK